MEEDITSETNKAELQVPTPVSPQKLKFYLPWIAILIFVIVVVGAIGYIWKTSNNFSARNNNQPTQAPQAEKKKTADNFFFFSIPKPIENITLFDLPNTSPDHILKINDSLWFTGIVSIVEYDTKNGKLVSYSDPKRANCGGGDMLLVNGFIFAACRIDNIEDAFGTTRVLDTKLFTGHYGIYKINPSTHQVEYIFSKADGLLNGYNYRLYEDGDYIWIATFNGVGRINTLTNKVDFYTEELGFKTSSRAITYSVYPIIVDKDYVWAWGISSVESQGGIAMFNKATSKWKAFGPTDLQEYEPVRVDLESSRKGSAIKLIPGGIQIAFRDGDIGQFDRLVEKQYSYASEKWVKISEQPATGKYYEKVSKYLESAYDYPSSDFERINQNGLFQLREVSSGRVYELDGRDNYILSPVIADKRYILTNGSIDVIDNVSDFRQILVKLGERIDAYSSYGDLEGYDDLVKFLINPESLLAVVLDSACGGMDCGDTQSAWLIDLKNRKLVKKYTKSDGLPRGYLFIQELSIDKDGDLLIIKDKNGKSVFDINIKTQVLNDLSAN